MKMSKGFVVFMVLAGLCLASSSAFGTPVVARFVNMGAPPAGGTLEDRQCPYEVSNDVHAMVGGPIVVGGSNALSGSYYDANVWQNGTYTILAQATTTRRTIAKSISEDGRKIGISGGVVAETPAVPAGQALDWSNFSVMTLSGSPDTADYYNTPQFAQNGAKAAASVTGGTAAIWDSPYTGTPTTIPGLVTVKDLSESGNWAVGTTAAGTGWGVTDISTGTTYALPLASDFSLIREAVSISGDGSRIVGSVHTGATASRRPVMWQWNGVDAYVATVISDTVRAQAVGISENGKTIALYRQCTQLGVADYHGYLAFPDDPAGLQASYGWINDKLAAVGVTLPTDAYLTFRDSGSGGATSPDGYTVAGQLCPIGTGNGGIQTGFFATLPEPASLLLLGFGALLLRRRR